MLWNQAGFFAFFLFFAFTWSWKSISSSYSSTSSPGPFLQKRNCVFTYLKTCLPIHSPPSLYVLGKYDWLLPPLSASPAFPSNNPIFFFYKFLLHCIALAWKFNPLLLSDRSLRMFCELKLSCGCLILSFAKKNLLKLCQVVESTTLITLIGYGTVSWLNFVNNSHWMTKLWFKQ